MKKKKMKRENKGLCYNNKFSTQFTYNHFNFLVMHMNDKIIN